jgi:transcriptional regulator with XRE-family HTH domain
MSRKTTRQVERSGFALALHLALNGTTTEAFARRIGRSLRTVQRWRNGESVPGAEDFAAILAALDLPPEFFYPVEEAA